MDLTTSVSASIFCSRVPFSTSQNLIVPPLFVERWPPADASTFPLGLKAMHLTEGCVSKFLITMPLSMSQNFMVSSSFAAASILPSGLNAKENAVCPALKSTDDFSRLYPP